MNKYLTAILFFVLLISPLRAKKSEQDSLRLFLEYIGTDSINIVEIMKSPEIEDPLKILDAYLMNKWKLDYDSIEKKLNWTLGCNDSLFLCRTTEYITQKIICDTALHLVDFLLYDACQLCFPQYDKDIRINAAEYAVKQFHSRKAVAIPYRYYINHKELSNWQEQLRLYGMIEFILDEPKRLWCFEKELNLKINKIIAVPNDQTVYYKQFRNLISKYSDMELARISKAEEKEFINILLEGVKYGEKKSQLTYAFMLLTGQFVNNDEVLGQKILDKLLE